MAIQQVTLEAAAKAFQVHPRTISRAITGDYNIYWSEDSNHDTYTLEELAKAYGTNEKVLNRVFENREKLLKPVQAAERLGMRPRTFREHLTKGRYKNGRLKYGKIVRYLQSKIIEHAIINEENME